MTPSPIIAASESPSFESESGQEGGRTGGNGGIRGGGGSGGSGGDVGGYGAYVSTTFSFMPSLQWFVQMK